ncbi:MAG: hypothetical protein ACXWZY_10565 [Gaiellaceae bacterium]
MEAASIAWRPLGRLLVEQGLLTDEELERALAQQQITGKRLGETIVECGFVSRPDLSNALASQYGIELTTETGFGTGLRAQIQQRHESDRGRVVPIGPARPPEPAAETDAQPTDDDSPAPAEAALLAQLEEQWAKLAAAEEQLAEREAALAAVATERDEIERRFEELTRLGQLADDGRAEREHEVTALSADRDRRRAQAVRFVRRVRERDQAADNMRAAIERLTSDVRGCDAEIERLRNENTHRRAQAARLVGQVRELRREPAADPVVLPSSHLVFLQLSSGYELVEREGPPPALHSAVELPGLCDGMLVVAGSRPSPFPGDARPCIVAQPA